MLGRFVRARLRTGLTLVLCVGLVVWASVPNAARSAGAGTHAEGMVSVIVTLRDQANVRAIAKDHRRDRSKAVVQALRSTADKSQRGLLELLEARRAEGRVGRVVPLWIFNGLAVTAAPDVIEELSRRPEVQSVSLDQTIPGPASPSVSAAPEPNISLVNVLALWDLGYRGQGVVVANMDTGVDVSHPDLSSRWRGGGNSWYDPNGEHPTTPTDVNGHGTATMGVIVGGDSGGTGIGIAPDAQWIAVKIFDDGGQATTSGIHLGFQWVLDPDGDPTTPDAPNVVNNSWSLASPGCNLDFRVDLQSLRAAGILPVFAAGNYGPGSSTSVSPANNPEAFAVGATDNNDVIFSESSRGPSACGEAETKFPELVAPGVEIWSSDLFGGYTTLTGTSLAAPHVAGVLALLLGAFPDASADTQTSALEGGAVDLGVAGADDTFGYGRLDALAAYDWLNSHPDFSLSSSPATASTLPGGSVTYTASIVPANGFDGDVTLSLGGLSSSQASWTFTPPTVAGGSGSSQLSVTTSASLPPGSYPLTISGSGGGLVRSSSVTLVVIAPPDFDVSAAPLSASTVPGGSVGYTVSITPANGFDGDVTLSLGGLSPSQASWTFASPTVVGGSGSVQLSLTTASSLLPGSYPLTISGSGGGLLRSGSVTLVVDPAPDFVLSITPPSRTITHGDSTTYTITVGSIGGFSGKVALSTTGRPPGAKVKGLPTGGKVKLKPSADPASRSFTMTVKTSGKTPPGKFTLTVTGKSSGITHRASSTLTVT